MVIVLLSNGLQPTALRAFENHAVAFEERKVDAIALKEENKSYADVFNMSITATNG